MFMFENSMAGRVIRPGQRADACKECGQCEDLCPQTLLIRDLLKDVAREFAGQEPFSMPRLVDE